MNDRFKFRIYCKSEKKMMLFNNPTLIDGDIFQGGLLFKNYDHKITNCHEVNPEDLTLMQCTGLKDKNGTLIYEGDILQSEEYPFKNDRGYNYSAEVCYDEESASYFYYVVRISTNVVGRAEGNTGHLDDYEWEVIGNIYENKGLLDE